MKRERRQTASEILSEVADDVIKSVVTDEVRRRDERERVIRQGLQVFCRSSQRAARWAYTRRDGTGGRDGDEGDEGTLGRRQAGIEGEDDGTTRGQKAKAPKRRIGGECGDATTGSVRREQAYATATRRDGTGGQDGDEGTLGRRQAGIDGEDDGMPRDRKVKASI